MRFHRCWQELTTSWKISNYMCDLVPCPVLAVEGVCATHYPGCAHDIMLKK